MRRGEGMNCPECGNQILSGARGCSCGWQAGTARSAPPPVMDTLVTEINRIGLHRFSGVPNTGSVTEFARYWITLNEKPDERYESPREVQGIGKESTGWVCPYHNRLVNTLRVFAKMPHADRRIILAGIDDRVWWRGEPAKQFIGVIDETHRQRKIGVAVYREEAIRKLGSFVKTHVSAEAIAERQAIQEEGND